MKEIIKLVLKYHLQDITTIFWPLSDLETWCWIWQCLFPVYKFLFSIESITSDVALFFICSKRDSSSSTSRNAGLPSPSMAHHHTSVTLHWPKGYLTWSMRAWAFGSSSRSGHSSEWGQAEREKCRTRLDWQLHLSDGITAQPLLYLQMRDWEKKLPKSIKKLTLPAFGGSCASLLTLPILLTQQSFVWTSKPVEKPHHLRRDQHGITHCGNRKRRHPSWISNACLCETCMRIVKNRTNCKSEQFQ